VLRVILAVHGGYAAPGDRLVAAGAQGAPFGVIVGLAVGLSLVVEEGAPVERRPTVLSMNLVLISIFHTN
jgi:hypothetical protein